MKMNKYMTEEQKVTVKALVDTILHFNKNLDWEVDMEMQFYGKKDVAVLQVSGEIGKKEDFQYHINPDGSIQKDSLVVVEFSKEYYS